MSSHNVASNSAHRSKNKWSVEETRNDLGGRGDPHPFPPRVLRFQILHVADYKAEYEVDHLDWEVFIGIEGEVECHNTSTSWL